MLKVIYKNKEWEVSCSLEYLKAIPDGQKVKLVRKGKKTTYASKKEFQAVNAIITNPVEVFAGC